MCKTDFLKIAKTYPESDGQPYKLFPESFLNGKVLIFLRFLDLSTEKRGFTTTTKKYFCFKRKLEKEQGISHSLCTKNVKFLKNQKLMHKKRRT